MTTEATAQQIEISTMDVKQRIYTLRGIPVMFDVDLAEIYEVEARALRQSVKRNMERFSDDFVFEPTKEELASLISQNVISKEESCFGAHLRPSLISQNVISKLVTGSKGRGGNRYTPFAFTEFGVAMLSSVLNSPRAIQVNIAIIRAFVQLRKEAPTLQRDLTPKLESLESLFMQRFDRLEAQIQTRAPVPRLPPSTPNAVSVIQNAVARHFGLSCEDLSSTLRSQAISLPRHIAMYLVRTHLSMSFTEIGWHFGRRDHSTVMHAYHKIDSASSMNQMIRSAVDSLKKEIQVLTVQ